MIYAIGDIHGHLDQLDRALALVEADGGRDAHIVFLGDYTDRGPNSRGVIERLMGGLDQGRNWTCIKGNHDRMFEWFVRPEPRQELHLPIDLTWHHERLGGLTTLASYGVDVTGRPRLSDVHKEALLKVPSSHIDFLKTCQLSLETTEYFFAHAGIRPGVSLSNQTENDLLWIRQGFVDDTTIHPKIIVHGHTAVQTPEHNGTRINLDGGAGYGRDLWPARFDGLNCTLLTSLGPIPLIPSE
ncbi:MAG: metallophosphoesterase family protein [Litoreibacter sp.]